MDQGRPIVPVAPPWKLRGDVYIISFWTSASQAKNMPGVAYSPLEAASSFAGPEAGRPVGGLSMFQIIRYTESPVGPYDELIISPGAWTYDFEGQDGRRMTKKNPRISRIYVSQKYTCWNGRNNWNIPKHLARFVFDDLPSGSMQVRVYPHDTIASQDNTVRETAATSDIPLFQATFQPMRYIPSFPFSLSIFPYIGIETALVQPSLPAGEGHQGELPGTDRWCRILPEQSTRRASLGWVDMKQADDTGESNENFWPGMGRWLLGVKMADCDIRFGEGEYWAPPATML